MCGRSCMDVLEAREGHEDHVVGTCSVKDVRKGCTGACGLICVCV